MKAKKLSTRIVSIVLSVLMMVSMLTIAGIAPAAVTVDDAASTGASGTVTVYFNNTLGWSDVYVCFLSGSYWSNTQGTGSYGLTCHKMSQYTGNYYSYTYTGTYSEYINFVAADQSGYGNYWQTAAVYRGDFNTTAPCFTPSTTSSGSYNSTTYYSSGSWGAAPTLPSTDPIDATVYLADGTGSRWVESDAAKLYVNDTEMKKSIDEHTGRTVWVAELSLLSGAALKYERRSALDSATVWNSWNTTFSEDNPCLSVYDDSTVLGTAPTIPAGTAEDYWYGFWVDTVGEGNTDQFVKLYAGNYYTDSDYYLYLPSYVNRSAAKVYSSLATLSIGSTSVTKGTATTVNLSNDTYTITYKRYASGSSHTGTLHILQSSDTAAMMMTNPNPLVTTTVSAYVSQRSDYKESTTQKGGTYYFYDEDGAQVNADTKIKKIKGRGNSTFEASMQLYGKYAYNINLDKAAELIEGATKSKKFSMLANNADETNMRNVVAYGIGDALDMPYTPNTRLVDVFDNGNYLGAYVIAEKVEYGKNTLIPDATSLDDMNEELAENLGIDYDALVQKTGTYTAASGTTYTYQYNAASESGKTYEYTGTYTDAVTGEEVDITDAFKDGDFLLEFELDSRYDVEGTWFRSNRTGQAVVANYPEFATQKEVIWMIDYYDALEDAVYDNDYERFAEIADAQTFADVYLLQELTENLDAGATSFHVLGGGSFEKLLSAPIWDYDWALGGYNGSKLTVSGSVNVSDYNKTFVKDKSVKIDNTDTRSQSVYNMQAKLAHNSDFWNLCQYRWTNAFADVMSDYLGSNGIIIKSLLPHFSTSAAMNESRFGFLQSVYNNAESYWGTRSTAKYAFQNFNIGTFYASGSENLAYSNTVWYLNDWLENRVAYMNTGMGLYNQSATIPTEEEPTEESAEPTTEEPVEESTAAEPEETTEEPEETTEEPEETTEEPVETTEAPEETTSAAIADGYYLVGSISGVNLWSVADVTADRMFVKHDSEFSDNEYVLREVELKAGDEFKAILYKDGAVDSYWYGSGEGNANFLVTEDGTYTIYFQPYWNNGWNGHFWLQKEAVEESTAAEPEETTEEPEETTEEPEETTEEPVETTEAPEETTEEPVETTEAPEETTSAAIADGYYLVGSISGVNLWSVADVTADRMFVKHDSEFSDNEYVLREVELKAGDEFKAILYKDGAVDGYWYGSGEGNANFAVTEDGTYTIYFQPYWNNGWNGHFWLQKEAVEESTAAAQEESTAADDTTSPATPDEESVEETTEEPEETTSAAIADGYYLVGSISGVNLWSVADVTADRMFVKHDSEFSDNEYVLREVELKAGDEFKAILYKDGAVDSYWYGSGEGNANFAVTEDGTYDIYFQPYWNNNWNGHFWLQKEAVEESTAAAPEESTAADDTTSPATPDEESVEETTEEPEETTSAAIADGYYLVGSISGVNLWSVADVTADRKFVKHDSEFSDNEYVLREVELKAGDEFKAILYKDGAVDSYWYGSGEGNANFAVTEDGTYDIYFQPYWNNNWNGHFWLQKEAVEESTAAAPEESTAADDTTSPATPDEESVEETTEEPEETTSAAIADGYYLVGSISGVNLWSVADVTADRMFVKHDSEFSDNEYVLREVELKAGDEFKAILYKDGAVDDYWYGSGEGNANFLVTEDGTYTIYFQPYWNNGWNGHFWVVKETVEESTEESVEESVEASTEADTTAEPTIEQYYGDANGDGVLDVTDATLIQRNLAHIEGAEINAALCDVDGDGDVTIADVTLIQRYLAKYKVDGRVAAKFGA